jgi:hypothetical protein
MKPDYKAIPSTVLKLNKARWDLGDALVAECKHLIQRTPVTIVLVNCVRLGVICRKRTRCSLEDISKLRRVSNVFGLSTRRVDILWDLYAEAGTPEMLEAIIAAFRRERHSLRVTLLPSVSSGNGTSARKQRHDTMTPKDPDPVL